MDQTAGILEMLDPEHSAIHKKIKADFIFAINEDIYVIRSTSLSPSALQQLFKKQTAVTPEIQRLMKQGGSVLLRFPDGLVISEEKQSRMEQLLGISAVLSTNSLGSLETYDRRSIGVGIQEWLRQKGIESDQDEIINSLLKMIREETHIRDTDLMPTDSFNAREIIVEDKNKTNRFKIKLNISAALNCSEGIERIYRIHCSLTDLEKNEARKDEVSEWSKIDTVELLELDISNDDATQVIFKCQENFHEIVEVKKKCTTVFLKHNARFKVSDDSWYCEDIVFEAEFSTPQIKELMIGKMKEENLFPCGPIIHLYNLSTREEKESKQIDDPEFEGLLSIRHYLSLSKKDELVKEVEDVCLPTDGDICFVSFNEHTGELQKYEPDEQNAHSATVKIKSFREAAV